MFRKKWRKWWMCGLLLGVCLLVCTWDKLCQPEAIAVLAQVDPLQQTVFSIDLTQTEPPAPSVKAELTVEVVTSQPTEPAQRILIYHTHTYEAYKQQSDNLYKETEQWRTKDDRHNMIRVGEELARLLTAKGYQVVHDTQAYEPPQLSSAYTRSLQMLEERARKGEVYDLYIDLHRDAYSQSIGQPNVARVGDLSLARLMVLVGKGSGQSYAEKPDWEQNYAAAQIVTQDLNQQVEGLCRNISVKSGRFNQHVGECCLLIEVGNNENTLQEALASMPYLADSLHCLLQSGV